MDERRPDQQEDGTWKDPASLFHPGDILSEIADDPGLPATDLPSRVPVFQTPPAEERSGPAPEVSLEDLWKPASMDMDAGHGEERADIPNSQKPSSNERPAAPQRTRRRRRRNPAMTALVYVLGVIGVSLILATLIWMFASDILALNKEYRTAEVTLPQEIFTPKEITVKTKDTSGKTVKTRKMVQKADLGKVANILKEKGLIRYKTVFKIFAKLTKGDIKMAPGTYALSTDMDYRALISGMSPGSASRSEISVTIPEGYSMEQIFALLEEKGVATVAELNETAADHDYKFDFLEGIPLGDPHRLEGYLFPDTYRFYIGEDPVYAINKMLVNFTVMVPQETRQELAQNGESLSDIITIASLIEKETDGTDQALISSVIQNRLKHPDVTNGLLQIDATLAYINGGRVPVEADKAIDSPYNTYLYKGLPPRPIANPGSAAIWAAMHPKSTDYYYYALGTDGTHHYFKTYAEHQRFLASLPRD